MNQTERLLVEKLRDKLKFKFDRIEIYRKPSISPKVRTYLENRLSYIPVLQPELDMVLWLKNGEMAAVEVKAFNPTASKSIHPFCEGIGQALALHRFGFNYACLWFLFLDTNQEEADQYGAQAWSFIRKGLKLPLEFTYFQVEKTSSGDTAFHTLQYTGMQSGYQLLDVDDPAFRIQFRYPNPMRTKCVQQVIRKTLELWFCDKL
jgi:hypothetical protein